MNTWRAMELGPALVVDIEEVAVVRPHGENGGFELMSAMGVVLVVCDKGDRIKNEQLLQKVRERMQYKQDRYPRSSTTVIQQPNRRLQGGRSPFQSPIRA